MLIAFAVGGETPDNDDSTAQIVSFWQEDDSQQVVAGWVLGVAALLLVWFGGSLRRAISRAEGGDGRLAAISFAGSVIASVGILLFGSLTFAAATLADEVPAEVIHTISALNNTLFFPLSGGAALLLLASGLAFVYTAVLPRWLGWIAIVIGVLILTPLGFFALLAWLLWIAVVSVLLFRRGPDTGAAHPR
ncbi:hypothetical protein [Micromonospora sp. CPCC 206061]|uniref:hypothetical protein n=1 Tax=Micromonospora sp. CPCC 206061 TaxID=3122410 RepID=UPI002FF13F69